MSVRFSRVFAPVAVAGPVVLVVMVVSTASSPGAIARGRGDRALLTRCVKVVLGGGRSATPVAGSADPTLVSSLAVLRRARSAVDALPAAARLREELAAAGATTYDPSAAVLLRRTGAHAAVYGVPATISPPVLPAGCDGLPQFAGVGAYLALQADGTGSGPGACLISTQLVQSPPSGSSLPGAATPKPTKTLTVAGAACKSQAVLSGYAGALGDDRLGSAHELALIPNGVTAITYTLADGRRLTAPVAGNLVTPPAALSIPPTPRPVTATELGQQLAAHLPTAVTESGTGAYPITSLNRPDSLIADAVGSFSFLRGLFSSSPVSNSSGSISGTGASCSARTHRCVAVTVTTACNSHDRCQTTRTIHRYRYVTAKPPAGTTGPDTQPTAPIVGRTNRYIARPTKLTLVLSGPPHRQVVVLLSVSCFSRNSAASVGGPPLQVGVPSRTPIALPGPARTFRACDVGALVTSSQRGPVHVTVARG
ncbi:MAG: hypothetical protein M3071_03825 [Actinomycetota bacterium]|nr:hypothetical protein [Actinomycetota bacterium]